MENLKIGIYETIYGNTAAVTEESKQRGMAYDIDMAEDISIYLVDNEKLISEKIEDYI
jgi:hypothetical protein